MRVKVFNSRPKFQGKNNTHKLNQRSSKTPSNWFIPASIFAKESQLNVQDWPSKSGLCFSTTPGMHCFWNRKQHCKRRMESSGCDQGSPQTCGSRTTIIGLLDEDVFWWCYCPCEGAWWVFLLSIERQVSHCTAFPPVGKINLIFDDWIHSWLCSKSYRPAQIESTLVPMLRLWYRALL